MNDQDKTKRKIEVLGMIAEDAREDAMILDGNPFNGRVVAGNFGKVYAAIEALATIMKSEIELRQDKESD